MPRAERPLGDDDDAVTRFAADLRRLRQDAGGPPYRELAARAHYSTSTLADAAAGRKMPSLPVALAYVRACGGDPAVWEERWHAAVAESRTTPTADPAHGGDGRQRGPYVGLAAYGPQDAEWFFGRERLTEDMVYRVRSQRFLAVFGASGSGKSSLLRAGLLPRIRSGTAPAAEQWPAVLLTPGPHPLDACAAHVAAFSKGSATELREELGRSARALHLTVLQALADRPPEIDLLLVVDQFEEVFTLCTDAGERDRFISALLSAAKIAGSRTRLVLGVRADFYARCSQHPDLVEALRDAQLPVGPMTADDLRQAITRPAIRAECTVEGALLARVMADAAGEANALPLVSHALLETWCRRRGHALTLAGYEAAGGIRHALARTAEAVYTGLTGDQQHLVRGILLRLVALGEGTGDTKRRVRRDELDGTDLGIDEVLEALASARLVTLDTDTVEITHEALLRAWPRLRDWINQDRAGLLVHRQLSEAAAQWVREGLDSGALYRGARLASAGEWAERHRDDVLLDDSIREFLAASVRQENRLACLRRSAIAMLVILALVASGAAAIAFQQRASARAERDRAVAEQVLTEADQVRGTDTSLAAQLTLAAHRIRPLPESSAGLLATQNIPLSTPLLGHTGAVYAVAFSPDGRLLATGADDAAIRLWSLSDPTRPTLVGPPLRGHSSWVYWLRFSPDGRTLASASRDHTVRLWNVTDPARPTAWSAPLSGHTSYVFSVSFSGDGHTLATASYDGTVRLWDVHDPARPAAIGPPLTEHPASIASATFSPDGRTVASASHDHTIRLWNVTDPRHPVLWRPPLRGHSDVVYAVAFSADGHTLASVSNDRTVRLWDVHDPARTTPLGAPLKGHTDTILAVAFSPDGRTLATGGADHTIRLWDVQDPAHPAPLLAPLNGHTGFVNWIDFSPDGRHLASVSDDHTVRLWTLPGTTLTGHTGTVSTIAFSPDGRTLASGGDDRTIRLWDLRNPARPRGFGPPLTAHTGAVTRVAFQPGGKELASAGSDGTTRLWDVRDPSHPQPYAAIRTEAAGRANALAYSPDGHVLVTDGPHHSLRLWDVRNSTLPVALTAPLTGHISLVHWAAFSPDGRILASSSEDEKVRLWDVTDPAHPRTLSPIRTGDTGGTRWAAFAPGGRVLATADVGHSVRLWNIRDPAHVAPLGRPLTGHTGPVNWVGFAPDGRTLASAADDGTLRLWDVHDPARAEALGKGLTGGHIAAIAGAAYGPGGRFLVSAGDDRGIEITPMDLTGAIAHICATAGGSLRKEQWRQYVPEFAYAPSCR